MINQRLNSKTSVAIYGFCELILVALIMTLKNFFRSSPISLSLAGFIGSQAFFFLVIIIGQIYEIVGINKKPGYLPIAFSLILSNLMCFFIDPICGLSCFSFCVPIGIYLLYSSKLTLPKKTLKIE